MFENNKKNSDAQSLFNEIALALPADNPRSKGVRKKPLKPLR
ncbi:hypothetical protein QW180_29590 [Vibrio sinaloensis]|nr:hypothetical protein [Vibrio sinaloensis]